jgi:site-specific DNA-cytosine methylase
MKILSLFDGMSCGRIALERLGVFVSKYYACEIDKYAIQVSKDNYPNIIQLGDVVRLRKSLEMNLATLRHLAASDNYYTQIIDIKTNGIDMIIGGSPCQGFSFAGKQLRFDDERSVLFFEFVKIKELLNPRFWFLENVRMDKRSEAVISKFMGKRPYKFNSALVSAQNRLRLYWTNISIKSIPIDKGILLKDILQDEKEVGSEFYLSEKAIDFITKPMRLKKRFTALNGDKAICLTAKGNSNWTGTFIELPQSLVETRSEEGKENGLHKISKGLSLFTNL